MRNMVVAAAVVFAVFPPVLLGSAQQAASAPQASQSIVRQTPAAATPAPSAQDSDRIMDARLYMARKQYGEAAKIYEDLARRNPHNPTYLNSAGIAYMQEADFVDARKTFERATKVDKNFADAFNNLGTVWFSMKDYRRAIRYYQKALTLKPNTAPYFTNLGYAYFNGKQMPQAMDMFRQALLLDPTIFDAVGRDGPIVQDRSVTDHGLFNFMMAKSYAQMGDAKRCADYLRRAFEEGYKEMAKARTDPGFVQVLADPDVQIVLDQAAPLPPGQTDAPQVVPGAAPAAPPKT